jgi:hypothetical protein
MKSIQTDIDHHITLWKLCHCHFAAAPKMWRLAAWKSTASMRSGMEVALDGDQAVL